MFDMMEATRLEKLHLAYDPATGLRAVIAIHSTRLGPALGGCRYLPYPNDEAALRERDPNRLVPPLHGALLKNEQDVHLFERLAFLARRETSRPG